MSSPRPPCGQPQCPSHEREYATDPVNVPGPIRRSDLDWQLVAESGVVFAAIVMFVLLASIVGAR